MTTQNATVTDVKAFIETKIPAPMTPGASIDTSDVTLEDYKSDDIDISEMCSKYNWRHIRLVDEAGAVVPHARLELTYQSGTKISVVPFFPLILLAKQATLKIAYEKDMAQWQAQGSLKARNSYKFVASAEQLAAIEAKNRMNWETTINTETNNFIAWCGSYQPNADQLPVLWLCYTVKAALVQLGEQVYIRQVVPAGSDVVPLSSPELVQANKPTSDKIGDVEISKAFTFRLLTSEQAAA